MDDKNLHLQQIVETYTNRDKTLNQSLIVWTPTMPKEQADYWRSRVPECFVLYKITKHYEEGFSVNYPPDDVWYWVDCKW